jgi:hypothetical protein
MSMNRIATLPGGCKNLSDTVRVVALEGQNKWPPMTLAAAQKLAADQHAELISMGTDPEPIFLLVDEAMLSRLDVSSEISHLLTIMTNESKA